jgi:serine phosphatase RsbU (regulator of sigma subunit)/anti-sigma regulatory factor (Ser/Thr protein kinase)
LLELSVWLSGRLSFTLKYALIGVVVLAALLALSIPLWKTISDDRLVAERERQGLREVQAASELLAALVALRDQALAAERLPQLGSLDEPLNALAARAAARASGRAQAASLQERWRQTRSLPPDVGPPQRFAAFNGVINSVLSLIQASAQEHRLNVDAELDAALQALTIRLPQVLDTLGRQRGALALAAAEYSAFALSAQLLLTESLLPLRDGVAQLAAVSPPAQALQPPLEQLINGITAQQDAVDKMQDGPTAALELGALSSNNQRLTVQFIGQLNRAADEHLQERIAELKRSQWILGSLLVGALAAITYLFAGIVISTLRSLKSLAEGTDDFCAGRLDTRIRIDTRDELVQVARNFNTMAAEFSRLLGVIREQNESRERELATQVAARTAELAEKNEQLHVASRRVQEELALARDMQQALMPQDFPSGADAPAGQAADWRVHARMQPARELGGDFYDVIDLPDGRLGVLVADVSGKGVAAAFFMAVSRTVLLDLAATGASPSAVLAQANDLLCQRNPMELFVTVCYAILDPRDGRLVYACAGHPPPLLRHADGAVEELRTPRDVAMAVMPDMTYTSLDARLEPGEALLLYTDGVTEAFSATNEAYGDDRLRSWLAAAPGNTASPHALVDDLMDSVHRFVGDAEASDDLTCLILSRPQGGPSTMASPTPAVQMTNKRLLLEYTLPTQLPEIERLADAVSDVLPDRPDLAFSANLCLEELITNIITHGLRGQPDRTIHVRMSISEEWLEIILKDDAPPFDPFQDAPSPDLEATVDERPMGGLGVHLVKTLMDDARAYYDGSGNLIVLLKTVRPSESA